MPQVETRPTEEDVRVLCYYEARALHHRLKSEEPDWPSIMSIAASISQAAAAVQLGKVDEARDALIGRRETASS